MEFFIQVALVFLGLHCTTILATRVLPFLRYRSLPQFPVSAPLALNRVRQKLNWQLARMPAANQFEHLALFDRRALWVSFILTPAVFGALLADPPLAWVYLAASFTLAWASRSLSTFGNGELQ